MKCYDDKIVKREERLKKHENILRKIEGLSTLGVIIFLLFIAGGFITREVPFQRISIPTDVVGLLVSLAIAYISYLKLNHLESVKRKSEINRVTDSQPANSDYRATRSA